MKNIKILFVAMLMLFSSCDKYLAIQPANILVPQNIADIKKMVGNYLYSMYNGEIQYFCLYRCMGYANFQSMFQLEDDINYENMFFLFYGTYEESEKRWISTDWENSIWNSLYSDIGDFNLYIYELEKLNDNSVDAKQVEAEVRMCRAISYFRLLQLFCPYRVNEFASDPERFGLPILEKEQDLANNFYPKRLSQKETYDFILKDLKIIESLDVQSNNWNMFYNKRALNGLLSEIYHWRAESPAKEANDWELAKDYAEKSIANNSMAKSELEIMNMFNPLSNSNSPALIITVVPDYGGEYSSVFEDDWYNVSAEDALYNLYSDDDYRKKLYFDDNQRIIKYKLADEGERNIAIFWRVEEQYLVIAEAYHKMGNDNKAREYLNELKSNRMSVVNNYTDVLDEIKKERRKELFGEPMTRWKDMKRYGVEITRYERKTGAPLKLEANDYKYTFVIPVSTELQQNPNNFQNPGWTKK